MEARDRRYAEQERAAEQSRAEQSRAEQSRAEPFDSNRQMKLMTAFDLLTDGLTGASSDAVGGRIGNKSESKSREASSYSGQAARRLKSNPPLPAVAGERGAGTVPHTNIPQGRQLLFLPCAFAGPACLGLQKMQSRREGRREARASAERSFGARKLLCP